MLAQKDILKVQSVPKIKIKTLKTNIKQILKQIRPRDEKPGTQRINADLEIGETFIITFPEILRADLWSSNIL